MSATEQKHTPGPWWITDSGVRYRGGYICHTNQPTHFQGQDERYDREVGERRANKNLIAASPKLLTRLQEAVIALDALTDLIDGTGLSESDEFNRALDEIDLACAAIAEATGATHE